MHRMIKHLLRKYKYPPEGAGGLVSNDYVSVQTLGTGYEYKDFSAKAIGRKRRQWDSC